ncbi:MAG TPA: hypothetical protein VIK18_18940 [Pirellulales bacterium]
MVNLKRRTIFTLCALIVAAVIAVLAGVYCFVSTGGRTEFSPDTLERRGRNEFHIGGLVVYRSSWSYYRDELAQFLIDKGYWVPVTPAEPRWITVNRWARAWNSDTPLYKALRYNWVNWSDEHPEMARRLWPHVLRLLRTPSLRYDGLGQVGPEVVVADLLRTVHRTKRLPDLERELNTFDELMARDRKAGEPSRAADGRPSGAGANLHIVAPGKR